MAQQALTGQSTDLRQIRAALRAWDARARLQQSVAWLPRGLAIGLALAVLLAVAARLWPIVPRGDLLRLSGLLAGVGVVAALTGVWAWQRSPLDLARRFDRQFGLRERLSTALELSSGLIPTESAAIAAAQRHDAARVLEQVNARRGLPLRADWRSWALVGITLGLLVAAIAIPNPQEDVLAEQAAVEEAVAEQLERLEELRDEALEDPALTDAERAAVVETLDEAIETLSQRNVSREEAMAALDAAEQELRDRSEMTAAERQQAFEQAGQMFEQAGAGQVAEALAQGDFSAAGQALSDLAGQLEGLGPEEAQALAEQLGNIADALGETNPELAEALQAAADALQSGDAGAAGEALEQAGQQMAEAGEQGEPRTCVFADLLQEEQSELAGSKANPREGQASQPGQGDMGQAQPGQPGQGGEGSGEGPEAGQVAGETPRMSNAPPDGGERPPEIYSPQRVGGEDGEQVDITGEPEPGVPVAEGELAENPTGEANVPYTEVFADDSGAVNEALDNGYIPLGMRGLIRQYFTRLDPEQ